MGMGASNTLDRVCASIGLLDEAKTKFEPSLDVPNAGVLLALPALLVSGLPRHTEEIPETTKVVNPEYRGLNSLIRSQNSMLNRIPPISLAAPALLHHLRSDALFPHR